MASKYAVKSRKASSKTDIPPKQDAASEDEANGLANSESSLWLRTLMWFSLFILSSLASNCWTRAFEPQFGASWHDPWWTEYYDFAIYALLGCYHTFFIGDKYIKQSGFEQDLAFCFLRLAFIQMFQWATSLFLNQWQAFVFRIMFIDSLRSYALYQIAPWRSPPGTSPTAMARSSYSGRIKLALLAACAAHWTIYSTPRIDFSDHILNSLVAHIPYQLLPSRFLAFGIITVSSAAMMVVSGSQVQSTANWLPLAAMPVFSGIVTNPRSSLPFLVPHINILVSGILTASSTTMAVVTAFRGSKWDRLKVQSTANWLLWAAMPVFIGLLSNPRSPMPSLMPSSNTRLNSVGYELLARGDGRATGYVSVLQNNKDGFRVLRCGHSLLGGYWLQSPGIVKDPIYGVFVMLEAVRHVAPTDSSESVKAKQERLAESGSVLVIGVGIGTAPAAFIHHGMDVTIVEIDQIVYDYAVKYFDLPPRHKAVIGDAIEFVHTEQKKLSSTPRTKSPSAARGSHSAQYDFIVHDVFTGGVEPAELFTVEFLTGLKDLLRPYGAIAINYAGDFKLPSTRMVLRTILAVFPSCRMFRETAEGAESSEAESDQTNMVLFCRKVAGDFEFRQPTQADFLGAPSREQWLMPEHEVAVDSFKQDCVPDEDCFDPSSSWYETFLWNRNVKDLEKWQHEAGKRHWELMRTVIPPAVWDNW